MENVNTVRVIKERPHRTTTTTRGSRMMKENNENRERTEEEKKNTTIGIHLLLLCVHSLLHTEGKKTHSRPSG